MFRLSSPLFVFATLLSTVAAQPVCSDNTGGACSCEEQFQCTILTVTKEVGDNPCSEGDCFYRVCFQTDYDSTSPDDCQPIVDEIDHSCIKDDGPGICYENADFAGYFSEATFTENLPDGSIQCQNVPAGGQAQFLFYDEQNAGQCGFLGYTHDSGSDVTCASANNGGLIQNFEGDDSCTTDIDIECVWLIDVPETCGTTTGIGGDPHLTRWGQAHKESFHGECDLVFLQSGDFNKGEGLDIHVRTTQRGHYSYVEQVGMRIGDDILSFDNDGNIVFNSMELTLDDLPFKFGRGQYKINYPYPGRKSQRGEGVDMKTYPGAIVYHIDLHDNLSYIDIKAAGLYMGVEVFGYPQDFGNGKGLSGHHETGARIGRDGQEHEDIIAFGMDWQVQEHEAVLFPAVREPQHPRAQCNMPTTDSRRVLKNASPELKAEAEAECMERFPEELDLCIMDVLASGSTMILDMW